MMRLFYFLLWPCWLLVKSNWFILFWIRWFLARTEVEGEENIPKKGGFVAAFNHEGSFDQFFGGAFILMLRKQKVFFIVDERIKRWLPKLELGTNKWFGLIFKKSKEDSSVLDSAEEVIQEGFPLLIFFEGRRRNPGEIPEPKTGVVRLHLSTGKPIVPAFIKSFSNRSFRQGARRFLKFLFIRKVKVIFGPPLRNILGEETEKARVLLRPRQKRGRSRELHELLRKGAKRVQEEVQKLALI